VFPCGEQKARRATGWIVDRLMRFGLPEDVKGNIYEGLLARNAESMSARDMQSACPFPARDVREGAGDGSQQERD